MGAPPVSPAFVLRGSCVGRHYALPVLVEEVIAPHTPTHPSPLARAVITVLFLTWLSVFLLLTV